MNEPEEESGTPNEYKSLKYAGVAMSLLAVPIAALSVFLDNGVRLLSLTITPQVLMTGAPLLALGGLTLVFLVAGPFSKEGK